MKKALLVMLASLIFQAQGFSQQNFIYTILSGGMMRNCRVYVPVIYDSQSPTPLVFNFHGLGGNAYNFEFLTKFKNIADTANFILVTPNGTVNPEFHPNLGQSWSTFNCCPTVDDVLFVSDMIDTLIRIWNVDTTRIYSAGFSNGGFMGYDLACRLSHRIAAIASVGGSIEVSRLPTCSPSRPVPILEIHGTNDQVVAFNSGSFIGVSFLATDSIINYWVENNQCSAMPEYTALPDLSTTDGSTVERFVYSNCADGSTVELLKVLNGSHTWPGTAGADINHDISAGVEIWRFFLKNKLDVISSTSDQPNKVYVTISPNPTSDFLHLTFSGNQNSSSSVSLLIADLFGRIVHKRTLAGEDFGHSIPIDLTSIPIGVYFLIVETNGSSRVFRNFVVAR